MILRYSKHSLESNHWRQEREEEEEEEEETGEDGEGLLGELLNSFQVSPVPKSRLRLTLGWTKKAIFVIP